MTTQTSTSNVRPAAVSASQASRRDHRRHVQTMWTGLVLLVVGIIITSVTYSFASSGSGGGTFVVCYGPILFGAIRLVTGFFGLIFSLLGGR